MLSRQQVKRAKEGRARSRAARATGDARKTEIIRYRRDREREGRERERTIITRRNTVAVSVAVRQAKSRRVLSAFTPSTMTVFRIGIMMPHTEAVIYDGNFRQLSFLKAQQCGNAGNACVSWCGSSRAERLAIYDEVALKFAARIAIAQL